MNFILYCSRLFVTFPLENLLLAFSWSMMKDYWFDMGTPSEALQMLKIDHPAAKALAQIDQKGYLLPFDQSGLRLHKVGISISSEERTLSEWEIIGGMLNS